jgi:inner membrane protein
LDNITHTLVGVTLVRAGLGRGYAGAVAVMAMASNLPDADIVTAVTGGAVPYLAAHRGVSHGVLGVVAFGVLAAALVAGWQAARHRHAPTWRQVAGLMMVGLAGTCLHVLMDLPTSYGTRVLSPFSNTWFAFDWLPIIDVYLWVLLAAGFVVTFWAPARRTRIARLVLLAVVANYALRAVAHGEALAIAATTRADGTAAPCASAPDLTRHPTMIVARRAGPGDCLQAAALPTFFSPFTWRLIRQQSDGYELREVQLGHGAVSPRVFVPSESDDWVAAARRTWTARVFLAFSRFPATRSAVAPDGTHRVRFVDVRFLGLPPASLEQDPPVRAPFVVRVDIAPDGAVLSERLGN